MPKVKNRKVIAHLALRELKANRRMNAVVILSIILTCVLFTALTTVGGSMINGGQQETMRMVGGDRMAGLKYVLPEDYEKVLSDSAVRDVTYRIKRKDSLDLFADFLGEMILKYADVIDIASLADPGINKEKTSGRTIIKDESIESKL